MKRVYQQSSNVDEDIPSQPQISKTMDTITSSSLSPPHKASMLNLKACNSPTVSTNFSHNIEDPFNLPCSSYHKFDDPPTSPPLLTQDSYNFDQSTAVLTPYSPHSCYKYDEAPNEKSSQFNYNFDEVPSSNSIYSYNFFDEFFKSPTPDSNHSYYKFDDPPASPTSHSSSSPSYYKFGEPPASPTSLSYTFDESPVQSSYLWDMSPSSPLSSSYNFDEAPASPEFSSDSLPLGEYKCEMIDEAFQCRIQTIRIYPKGYEDINIFLTQVANFIFRKINVILNNYKTIKVFLRLEAIFSRNNDSKIFNFKAETFLATPGTDLNNELDQTFAKILFEIDCMNEKGSGWVFEEVSHIDLCISECDVIKASSYIPLPKFLADKHAIINVLNHDLQCFQWSILAHLYPVAANNHPNHISHYTQHADKLNFTNIPFPVAIHDIHKFEKLNNISVNLFSFNTNTKKIYPLYFNCKERLDKVVDLLLLKNGDKSHYCLIKSLSRLLSTQVSKHRAAHFFCRNCLNHFTTDKLLAVHENICLMHDCARIELPLKFPFQTFMEYERMFMIGFIVYCDFECILKPSVIRGQVQEHIPSSFAYFIKNNYGKPEIFKIYRGADETVNVADVFIKCLYKDAKTIYNKYLNDPLPVIMTPENEIDFKKATHCSTCKNKFTHDKNLDHDHLSGLYRAALCNKCNLKCKMPSFLPVIFHGGGHYDFHLLVKSLCLTSCPGDVHIIPRTDELYISIIKNVDVGKGKKFSLRFLDSFNFLPYSLDTLVRSLKPDQFVNTIHHFPGAKHKLILRKGVFPYDYITDFEKYNDLTLPTKEDFFSKLYNSSISDEDYFHAQEVWKSLQIKNLGQYSDFYLTTDIFLLCDVFETFRFTSMKNYQLDPAYFYTSPSLSWSAMMKFTGVRLQLLTDYDMILFIERGIRGGVSQVSHRYAEANNSYIKPCHTTSPVGSSYLFNLDVNNLYAHSMCAYLPLEGFTWLPEEEFLTTAQISNLSDTADKAYILEVDLEYPDDLHELHNQFPLAPLNQTVESTWLSNYLGVNYKLFSIPKLLTTLFNKSKYIIHSQTLKLYLSLGLKLIKTYRTLSFKQSPWLRKYIDKNTELRQQADDQFGKDFFKLMNNSIYGKSLESVRKRQRIVLCHNWKKANRLISKPAFKMTKVFSKDLVAVHLYKEKLVFNKPIYVGMTVLDLSKNHMYNFHYNVMVAKYKNNITLLYTDTDSLIYWLKDHNFYDDLKDPTFKFHFDLSNYPSTHELASNSNKMVLGKWKDECAGEIITHFIGLRSKMYAYKLHGGSEIKKSKGVKRHVIKNNITYQDYANCLNNKQSLDEEMANIASYKHIIYTNKMTKKILCPKDDKKYILEDGITCLSYGHKEWRNRLNQ